MTAKVIRHRRPDLGRPASSVQFLGGRGYMENNLAPQILRDARALSITEGPNEPLTQRRWAASPVIPRPSATTCDPAPKGALADLLATSCREIAAEPRCLAKSRSIHGPLQRRLQLWCDMLCGQVASDVLLLSAVREANLGPPRTCRVGVEEWARSRLARTMQRARMGSPRGSV